MPRAHIRHDQNGSAGIEAWGGVLTGTVQEWADALDCTPAEVVEAIEAAGIELLVDTSKQKRQERDRPTDPQLRSLAMVPEEASALRDAVGDGEGPHQAEQIPPERAPESEIPA
jgi:hypothetical protein